MTEEVKNAIDVLERYIESLKEKISTLEVEAKISNPIIGNGYFRIVEYRGRSKQIKDGRIYKGFTRFNRY